MRAAIFTNGIIRDNRVPRVYVVSRERFHAWRLAAFLRFAAFAWGFALTGL